MSARDDNAPATRSGSGERAYLLRRAGDHGRLAAKGDDPGARAIHQRLQQLYQDRADAIAMVVPD